MHDVHFDPPFEYQYPRRGCPPGHNAYSPMVPFIPLIENVAFFTDSRALGYDYDNHRLGNAVITSGKLGMHYNLTTSCKASWNSPTRILCSGVNILNQTGDIRFDNRNRTIEVRTGTLCKPIELSEI